MLKPWVKTGLRKLKSYGTMFLIFINVILSFQLLTKEGGKAQPRYLSKDLMQDLSQEPTIPPHLRLNTTCISFDFNLGRYDKKRRYKIHEYFVIGDEWRNYSHGFVSIATQASVDRLHWLYSLSKYWSGPISISVFVPNLDFTIAVEYISFLRKCSDSIRNRVTFHLSYPLNHPPVSAIIIPPQTHFLCNQPEQFLKKLLLSRPPTVMRWRETLPYPQNLMRNIARKTCQTEYVFLIDVDILPKKNLYDDLEIFLKQKSCDKCVYVVPTYEIVENIIVPESKQELLKLVKAKRARPFHETIFKYNQYATNFSRWEKISQTDQLDAAFKVTNYEFFYEPFYIAKDNVPEHDERFVGYGYTRNTQVFEVFEAGYEFLVLNDAFATHKGFQSRKSRPRWRERENVLNRRFFDTFKHEVKARYGKKG